VHVLHEIEDAVAFSAPGQSMQLLPKVVFVSQFKAETDVIFLLVLALENSTPIS
jgi:hypothetical protein